MTIILTMDLGPCCTWKYATIARPSLSLAQGAFIHCGTAVEYLHHMCHSSFMKEASLFSHEAEVKYVGAPPLHQGESLLLGVTANSINSHYVLPLYNIWIKSIEVIE